MNIKTESDYTKKEKKVFKYLTLFGNQRVVGSNSLKEIQYANDYDLMETVEFERDEEGYKLVWELFKEKFKNAKENKTIWITDFKCGILPNTTAIRWNYKDLMKGYQIIEDIKYKFTDCLQQKSMIKMDIIALIDGLFNEFSEIYFTSFGEFKAYNHTVSTEKSIIASLLNDVKKYTHKGDHFKSIKRLFAYYRMNTKYVTKRDKIVNFLNSITGELGTYKNDLELIQIMLTQNFNPVSKSDIEYNLEHIKKHIKDGYKSMINELLKNITKKERLIKLESIIEILNNQIQKNTLLFIKQNKNIYNYIKE